MKLKFYILIFLLGYAAISSAQHLSNHREKYIITGTDTVLLDTLSLIPGSVILENVAENKLVSPDDYRIDEVKSILVWLKKPQADSIKINYRVFPYQFNKAYYHKDINQIRKKEEGMATPYVFYYDPDDKSSIDFGKLNYNGSISRGISFGNNQDVVVNSSLNLQLSGMLTKDIEVIAAITDENIPVQPEGNTQQIQEFDKVYIRLNKDKTSLTVGDIDVKKPNSYFMNFRKKGKGAQFNTIAKMGKEGKMHINPTVSVAKGKFAKNAITGQEGNQGPYKLTGNNGESFVIILAGTERIYIDGQLMVRGADNDYVIDYNLGEITFTPKRLITKDSRITVEFEYSDQNYFRSLIHLNDEYHRKKWNVKFNMYSEQDHKNQQTAQQTLSDEDKQLLGIVGDSIYKAFLTGIDSIGFESDRIMYDMIDTTVGITYDSVFIYSTDPDSADYALSFSYVGEGNGNYLISDTAVNGRVYYWVAPVGGQPQGAYEPVILIITPKMQQLYTLGAEYKFSKTSKATVELALSNNDINTFSSLDKQDNVGYAAKVGYNNTVKFNKEDKKSMVFKTKLDYEYVNKLFEPLERYRTVEFERDWNLGNIASEQDENIGTITVGIAKPSVFNLDYGFSTFIKGADYNGIKHDMNSRITRKGFRLLLGGSLLNTEGSVNKTRFIRPKADISKDISILKGVRLGAKGEMERNEIRPVNADTLANNSFQYISWSAYLKSNDSLQNKFSIAFTQRIDKGVLNNSFKKSMIANTFNITNELLKNKKNKLRWSLIYRDLIIKDSTLTNEKSDNSLMGRLEYNLTGLKGTIRSNTLYELARGLEQKREFTYVKVTPGEGNYIWQDFNSNDIKETNEFIQPVLPTDLPDYIRVINPTNEYESTYLVQFNQSLRVDPKAIWYTKKGIKKLISRFSTLSTLQIQRKTLDNAAISHYNPFMIDIADTSLVSLTSIIRNTLYFNRSGTKLGFELNTQNSSNKLVLVSGFEKRIQNEESVKLRWNISKSFASRITYRYIEKENESETAPDNAYWIITNKIAPNITYRSKNNFRISLDYEVSFKENKIDSANYSNKSLGGEESTNHNISMEARYNIVSKSSINIKFSFIMIDFKANQKNSSIAFTMLEGLQDGNNALWNVSWNRKLENNMQISLIYDGRKSEESNTVHIGRAQVRYIF